MQVVLLKTKIAGGFFYPEGWKVARDLIQEGQYLHLEREPDNRFDENAVAVWFDWDGPKRSKLGYVARKAVDGGSFPATKRVADFMARNDGRVICQIPEFQYSEITGNKPELPIELLWLPGSERQTTWLWRCWSEAAKRHIWSLDTSRCNGSYGRLIEVPLEPEQLVVFLNQHCS